jgi:hypothetical protein
MGKPLLGMNERYGVASLASSGTEEKPAKVVKALSSAKH